MKPSLSAQMQQSLHLTPQLLQSIRLLQLDGMQLELEVRRALEQNPLLELDESQSASEAQEPEGVPGSEMAEVAVVDDWPDTAMWDGPVNKSEGHNDDDPLQRLAAPESSDLHLTILSALALELPPRQWEAAVFWLEHCDDAGYLDADHASLLQIACTRFALGGDEIEAVRQHLLHGEPSGMAARDLGECLQAQLTALPNPVPGRCLARRIVETGLDLLAAHDYPALAARVNAEEEDIGHAVRLIQSLHPRPGESLSERAGYIIPEVLVRCVDGQWQVALNPRCTPRVCVNPVHEKALCSAGHHEAVSPHLRELLQQARGFAHGLSVRHDTLLRTAREIVAHQSAWLTRGDEAMAPLTLKNIADSLGVHESTISRITTGKYMQTPRGTFELKYFFAVRLEGAEVSGAAVKAMVKRLIDSEPLQRPLADEAIAALLARQGVNIARRTVAKYREQLGIASARVRRRRASGGESLRARAG